MTNQIKCLFGIKGNLNCIHLFLYTMNHDEQNTLQVIVTDVTLTYTVWFGSFQVIQRFWHFCGQGLGYNWSLRNQCLNSCWTRNLPPAHSLRYSESRSYEMVWKWKKIPRTWWSDQTWFLGSHKNNLTSLWVGPSRPFNHVERNNLKMNLKTCNCYPVIDKDRHVAKSIISKYLGKIL
jgi:hypothetical protein